MNWSLRSKVLFVLGIAATISLYSLDRSPPHQNLAFCKSPIRHANTTSQFAIATFLTGRPESLQDKDHPDTDYYYIATRILAYQILHAPETRCNEPIPFVILVTSTVSERAKRQLREDGARVVEAKNVPLRWWIKTGVTRWKDQFTKLRLFEMTEYDRILFIDADTLIQRKLDKIFCELEVQRPVGTLSSLQKKADESLLPTDFVFAARSDNALTGERNHPFPPLQTEVFSAGFWLAAPSTELFEYFLSVMNHYRRFDPHTMEQSLLNYAFRRDGPMPWSELHYQWSATWPNLDDFEAGVATLHEKFWSTGPQELQDLWRRQKDAMERHFASHAK